MKVLASVLLLITVLAPPPVRAGAQAVDEWPGSMALTSNPEHTVAILTLDRATEDSEVDVAFAILDPSEALNEAVAPGALRFEGVIMPAESKFIEVMFKSGRSYLLVTPGGAATEPRVSGATVIKVNRLLYLKASTTRFTHESAARQLLNVKWPDVRR